MSAFFFSNMYNNNFYLSNNINLNNIFFEFNNYFFLEPILVFNNISINLLYLSSFFSFTKLITIVLISYIFILIFKKNSFNWFYNFLVLNEKELNAMDDFLFIFLIIFISIIFNSIEH